MPTVKEKPIIAYPHEVKAILNGQQTQFRRIVKGKWLTVVEKMLAEHGKYIWDISPHGDIGDRLWVRETFIHFERELEYADVGVGSIPIAELSPEQLIYRADWSKREIASVKDDKSWKWKPSTRMPRWASRINLEITGIRVEEIQRESNPYEWVTEFKVI